MLVVRVKEAMMSCSLIAPACPHQNVTYVKRRLKNTDISHARDGHFLFIFLDSATSKLVLRRGGPRIWPIDWGVCLQEVWCQRSMAWAKLNGSSTIEDVIITIVKEN